MIWYLDTNICIGCLRGTTPIIEEFLQGLEPSKIKIPAMVKAELLHGAIKSSNPEKNQNLVNLFLAPFGVEAFDDAAAVQYSRIRSELELSGQIIGFNDLIIAATVLAHAGTLVTANMKEFSRVTGLDIENWVSI